MSLNYESNGSETKLQLVTKNPALLALSFYKQLFQHFPSQEIEAQALDNTSGREVDWGSMAEGIWRKLFDDGSLTHQQQQAVLGEIILIAERNIRNAKWKEILTILRHTFDKFSMKLDIDLKRNEVEEEIHRGVHTSLRRVLFQGLSDGKFVLRDEKVNEKSQAAA